MIQGQTVTGRNYFVLQQGQTAPGRTCAGLDRAITAGNLVPRISQPGRISTDARSGLVSRPDMNTAPVNPCNFGGNWLQISF